MREVSESVMKKVVLLQGKVMPNSVRLVLTFDRDYFLSLCEKNIDKTKRKEKKKDLKPKKKGRMKVSGPLA